MLLLPRESRGLEFLAVPGRTFHDALQGRSFAVFQEKSELLLLALFSLTVY